MVSGRSDRGCRRRRLRATTGAGRKGSRPAVTQMGRRRAAAAVGDGEGLVQVDVQQVDAEVAGAHLADHGVHVRAVAVDVAAHLVGQAADLGDLALEQAQACWAR